MKKDTSGIHVKYNDYKLIVSENEECKFECGLYNNLFKLFATLFSVNITTVVGNTFPSQMECIKLQLSI